MFVIVLFSNVLFERARACESWVGTGGQKSQT